MENFSTNRSSKSLDLEQDEDKKNSVREGCIVLESVKNVNARRNRPSEAERGGGFLKRLVMITKVSVQRMKAQHSTAFGVEDSSKL